MAQLTGATINVYSEKTLAIQAGARGTAAIALPLDWYEDGRMITQNYDDTAEEKLGHSLDAIPALREMMKRAATALIYPLNVGGECASAKLSEALTATAVRKGSRGNAVSITIAALGDLWQVKTFLNGVVMDSQLVADPTAFKANAFITITGVGAFSDATVTLSGGTDGDIPENGYDAFLAALKTHTFQTIAYTGSDAAIKQKLVAYVRHEREDEDKFIQVCMGNQPADYEGVISFANGVILSDGTAIDADAASAWLAGATAAAAVNASLTYDVYDGAVDVTERLTKSQQLSFKNRGLGCFILNNGKVKVESDINTLTTYTTQKGRDFCKNRVLRVIDGVCTDIKAVFDASFAGAESNNADGRNRFKASICDYMTALQGIGAVEEFVADDVAITAGSDKDTVLVNLRVKPVDSMEKANITVRVR